MQHPLTLDLHAECVHIELDQRFFFLALVRVFLAQADDGADRLGVVALSPLLRIVVCDSRRCGEASTAQASHRLRVQLGNWTRPQAGLSHPDRTEPSELHLQKVVFGLGIEIPSR